MRSAHIICVHVVPHFGGVLMMMSSGRRSTPCQRRLSNPKLRYRRSSPIPQPWRKPLCSAVRGNRWVGIDARAVRTADPDFEMEMHGGAVRAAVAGEADDLATRNVACATDVLAEVRVVVGVAVAGLE